MVRATDETRSYVEYVDQAAVDEFGGTDTMAGLGFGGLSARAEQVSGTLGVGEKAKTRIVVGQAPGTAGLWLGDYDRSTVDSWFAKAGAERASTGDATVWLSTDTSLTEDDTLHAVRTAPASFAWSPAETSLDWLTKPGKATLADDPAIADLATCLGDAKIAVIAAQPTGGTFAVGVLFDGADATEVACAAAPGGTDAMLASAQAALADGGLPGKSVEIGLSGDSVVRLQWLRLSGNSVGMFYSMLLGGELATIFGG